MSRSRAAFALLLAVGSTWAALPLPDYVSPCSIKASDRKISQCALEHARLVMPKVMKGDPKYNIPILDPLHVDRMEVINGEGPLGLQLITTDLNVYGLPDMIINSVTHVAKPLGVTYVTTTPEITVNGKYNITGRILLLNIYGQGNVVMKLKNMKIIYQYDAEMQKHKDGEIYFVPLPGERMDIEVDGLSVHLDNLFNGDKILLESTNRFLNEEWQEVYESLKPSFIKEISALIRNILKGIFDQVPMRNGWLDFDEFTKDKDKFQVVDKSKGP
ncbi:hypothetical protein R5R35_001266 [Gryllus longicercus]|uniref:Protein takeout n=1 Tax=Gryllus longicercus TaxID=2509291 RepID=A0AAN9VS43_9ORTH